MEALDSIENYLKEYMLKRKLEEADKIEEITKTKKSAN